MNRLRISAKRVASDAETVFASTFYRDHSGALLRVAFLITGSSQAAEDAVHEVFLRCLDRGPTLIDPYPYFYRAVVNECRTQYRRSARLAARSADDRSPAMATAAIETRDALKALTYRKRAVLVLRYYADLSDVEIAAVLSCRPATVRSLAHRALGELRGQLS